MSSPSPVLVLSADPLVEMVVRHLLPAGQYAVRRTASRDEVVAGLERDARLGVLDLPDLDGDALAFVRDLHTRAGKPLLVLTANPVLAAGEFEPAVRLLDRPPQLDQLQAALNAALAEPPAPSAGVAPPAKRRRWLVSAVGGAALAAVAAFFVLPMLGVAGVPNVLKDFIGKKEEADAQTPPSVKLLPGQEDAFELPPEVVRKMNIPAPFRVKEGAEPRALTLSGSLAFDPNWLARIQSRFPGEVTSLGTATADDSERKRPLQYGDPVKQGQLLAVVWSKDLGEKKSELVDSLSQLSLDQETLRKLQDIQVNVSQAVIRQSERQVSASLNAVNRAERTLLTWRVADEEIEAVKAEAKRIIERKGKRDPKREKDWARVEVLAPIDGVIVEKNVVEKNIVDPTQDLFKVADLKHLAVYAHVYEEDLRELQRLRDAAPGSPVPWRLHLTAAPKARPLDSPGIARLGSVIDPNQHTALAMGVVANTKGRLSVGQFVAAEVDLPPPPGVVSVPVAALDEDGEASHLLVQLDPTRPRYALRKVRVARRFLDSAYVGREVDALDWVNGFRGVAPGEWVVTGGAVQLKAALEEARARARVHK